MLLLQSLCLGLNATAPDACQGPTATVQTVAPAVAHAVDKTVAREVVQAVAHAGAKAIAH